MTENGRVFALLGLSLSFWFPRTHILRGGHEGYLYGRSAVSSSIKFNTIHCNIGFRKMLASSCLYSAGFCIKMNPGVSFISLTSIRFSKAKLFPQIVFSVFIHMYGAVSERLTLASWLLKQKPKAVTFQQGFYLVGRALSTSLRSITEIRNRCFAIYG